MGIIWEMNMPDETGKNTHCPRCGKNFQEHLNNEKELTQFITNDGIAICDECFTPEEEYEVYRTAHFLTTGHYPDTPECNCEDE